MSPKNEAQLEEELHQYDLLLQSNPRSPQVLINKGATLQLLGRWNEAVHVFDEAIEIEPTLAEPYLNKGLIFRTLQLPDAALNVYTSGLRFCPSSAGLYYGLAQVYKERGHLPLAIDCFEKAYRFSPDQKKYLLALTEALRQQNKTPEALAIADEFLTRELNYPEVHNTRGNLLRDLGRLEEAIDAYRQAIKLNSAFAIAYSNLGNALKENGLYAQAKDELKRAQQLDPALAEAHMNESYVLLLEGNSRQGFEKHEWRLKRSGFKLPLPLASHRIWNGSDLHGKSVLLTTEQGLGDILQFIRFARNLKSLGARQIIVEAPTKLHRILRSMDSVDELITADALPSIQFDEWCPLMSLPYALNLSLDEIPNPPPYLIAEKELVQFWKDRLGPSSGLRIGIGWQGNKAYAQDRFRSIPLKEFAPLFEIPDVQFVSLQKGEGAEQIRSVAFGNRILDFGFEIDRGPNAFVDTAAIIQNLDLVISSDTSLPHLAGALGKEVWLLTPEVPDWRWRLERDDSPWYPQMKLFRQKTRGNWSDVFERVKASLIRKSSK